MSGADLTGEQRFREWLNVIVSLQHFYWCSNSAPELNISTEVLLSLSLECIRAMMEFCDYNNCALFITSALDEQKQEPYSKEDRLCARFSSPQKAETSDEDALFSHTPCNYVQMGLDRVSWYSMLLFTSIRTRLIPRVCAPVWGSKNQSRWLTV